MRKRKIGAVALLLGLSLLVLASCGNGTFEFREKIRWGMSMEEVSEIEGETTNQQQFYDDVTVLTYQEMPVSKYQGDLGYVFYSDRLVSCAYSLWENDESTGVTDTLKNALDSVYGNSVETSAKELCEILDVLSPYHEPEESFQNRLLYKWNAPGNTAIFLIGSEDYQAVLYASPECLKIKRETDVKTADPEEINKTGL